MNACRDATTAAAPAFAFPPGNHLEESDMRSMLLAAAGVLAAIAAPAQAQVSQSDGFTVAQSGQIAGSPIFRGCSSGRHERGRAGCNGVTVLDVYGGDWARWNNRSFEPGSYNDWWHDRPDRAFPRWMQSNQNCDRMWWSGGGWRC
jgi:hypothetical protein